MPTPFRMSVQDLPIVFEAVQLQIKFDQKLPNFVAYSLSLKYGIFFKMAVLQAK